MTAIQEKRREAYRRQLKACGFRSWSRANRRRGELIDKEIDENLTSEELVELQNLQRLADVHLKWKTNDALGLAIRRAKRLLAHVTTSPKE